MNPIQAGQEPARTPVHILSVPRTGYIIVAFAGPLRGLLMHWRQGGSVPCLPEPDCPAAIHKTGSTWKGFAPVRQWDHSIGAWMPFALEITEALEEVLRGRDLRGEVWRLCRVRKKKAGGAVQGVLEEVRQDAALLVSFDVRQVIQRRYHVGELLWDVPNPVRPKLTVETTAAPPPASLPVLEVYQHQRAAPPLDAADRGLSSWERVNRLASQQKAAAEANGVGDGH